MVVSSFSLFSLVSLPGNWSLLRVLHNSNMGVNKNYSFDISVLFVFVSVTKKNHYRGFTKRIKDFVLMIRVSVTLHVTLYILDFKFTQRRL